MLKHLKRNPSRKGKEARGHNVRDDSNLAKQSSVENGENDEAVSPASASPSTRTLPPVPVAKDTLEDDATVRSAPAPPSKSSHDKALGRRRRPLPYVKTTVRPSTSTSAMHASPTLTSHLPYQNANAVVSVASENWTAPEDADGAYVRRTYAHFDARGVRGDGLIEGKEWTRERGSRAVWDVPLVDGTIRDRRLSMPATTQKFALKVDNPATTLQYAPQKDGRLSPSPAVEEKPRASTSSRTSGRKVEVPSIVENVDRSPKQVEALRIDQVGQHTALAASTSSLGSHSEESVSAPMASLALNDDDEMDVERKEMMKRIDRYGFFPRDEASAYTNARNRMTVMSAESLRSIPRRRLSAAHGHRARHKVVGQNGDFAAQKGTSRESSDGTGSDSAQASVLQATIQARKAKEISSREREALRERKWDRMMGVRRMADGKPLFVFRPGVARSSKLKRRIYKGVPDRWRAAVWWAMLNARPDCVPPTEHETTFLHLQRTPSTHDVQIDLDVPRTISGHILFHTRYGQGQRALFHVLHAFSLLCTDCGYCQGMGPIVATLLVYFPPERAYAVAVELHRSTVFGLHQTFAPGFPGLVENFYVQSKLLRLLCPDVAAVLEESGVVTSAYATKWYITLFTNVLPFATQLRIWDVYFSQGRDVLVVAAVALLWCHRSDLLAGNFEVSMKLLGSEFVPVDDDLFLNWIYLVMQRDDVVKCLTSARKEWSLLIERGVDLPIL